MADDDLILSNTIHSARSLATPSVTNDATCERRLALSPRKSKESSVPRTSSSPNLCLNDICIEELNGIDTEDVQESAEGGGAWFSSKCHGTATPLLSGENTSVESLQKVKEILRRLRWRQERVGDITPGYLEEDESTCRRDCIKQLMLDVYHFVCGEQMLEVPHQDHSNGTVTDPIVVAVSMEHQQERAQSRLDSLNQIVELLSTEKDKESEGADTNTLQATTLTTLLSSAHLQFLCGCFGLSPLPLEPYSAVAEGSHYQDGIKAAKAQTQQEVQLTVHRIYELLVGALVKTAKSDSLKVGSKQKLLLFTVLSLSNKYCPADVSLAVSCGHLLPLLYSLGEAAYTMPLTLQLPQISLETSQLVNMLNLSSQRLLQIISMSAGMYADRLSDGVVLCVLDILWKQLAKLIQDASCTEQPMEETMRKSSNSFHPVGETAVGDFLVYIRRIASSKFVQTRLSCLKWITMLLDIASKTRETGVPVVSSLRTRLIALHLLGVVLLAFSPDGDREFCQKIVSQLFMDMATHMWYVPAAIAKQQTESRRQMLMKKIQEIQCTDTELSSSGEENKQDVLTMQGACFDSDKTSCCSVENGHTLVHGVGGKGYGLGSMQISSGCFHWKFLIVKENRGNEGTCIGVSRWPVKDYSHRTTKDMWLYRAYSGNLYHNGEQTLTLSCFTQGDYVTVVLDMDAKTLSFGKNGEEPKLAFDDVDATELYPCVMFYSCNPGEKVKITDMQVQGTLYDLCPGDPLCTPATTAMVEAYILLIRTLHRNDLWTPFINEMVMNQLNKIEEFETVAMASPQTLSEEQDGNKAEDAKEEEEHGGANKGSCDAIYQHHSDSMLERKCVEVWPSLVLIGGLDHGLRVGGRCKNKSTSKIGTVLGLTRQGATTAKVQWDDSDTSISDTSLSNLEPVDPIEFDIHRLTSLSPKLLHAVMKLTLITDEKQRVLNVGVTKKAATKQKQVIAVSNEMTEGELMRDLDEEIAKALAQELAGEEKFDHNADKKGSSLAPDVDSAGAQSSEITGGLQCDKELDLIGVDSSGTANLDTCMTETTSDVVTQVALEADLDHESHAESFTMDQDTDDIVSDQELSSVHFGFIQLAALKTLYAVMLSNRYAEMLLVPKSDLTAESSKALPDGTVVRRDDDLKCVLRTIMKQMVKQATSPSPFRRAVTLMELERAQCVLHKIVFHAHTEDRADISKYEDQLDKLRVSRGLKCVEITSSFCPPERRSSINTGSTCLEENISHTNGGRRSSMDSCSALHRQQPVVHRIRTMLSEPR